MLRSGNVPLSRAWNTWSSRPAEMVFLPLGVRVTPAAYADSVRKATLFPSGDPVRFGRHALDGGVVELDLTHAGTRLAWRYRKCDPFEIVGDWRMTARGEWGLRFWINICLSCEDGAEWRWDESAKAAVVKIDHRFVALASEAEPVLVTGHATLEALVARYETMGYFETGARSSAAPVLALRFNLEMSPGNRFAVTIADSRDSAISRARSLVAKAQAEPARSTQTGRYPGALDAIGDVVAWNTVWDEANQRPYTSISRNWNLSKFGGFGVWLNDQQYAGLLASVLDAEMGRENLAVALASATPDGNFACLISANDAWVDRNQPPLGSFLVWLMYLRSGSRPLLETAYDALARNHAWWLRRRDPFGRGLVSYGTSDLGEGLYKGKSFGSRNESAMDNSPVHDEAEYDPATRTLTSEDVGLNSLLALDAEMLSKIARELGRDEADAFAQSAERLREKIRVELWDAERGVFANRLRSGRFVRSVAPTSFYPMLAGAATPEQVASLLTHLRDPSKFGGEIGLPGVSRDDPAYADNMYWRGRVWPTFNYLVWQALRRYGEDAAAEDIADRSFALFARYWERDRICAENYNAESGEPLDQADTERFYTWGALMALLAVSRVMDIGPWRGWELVNDGADTRLGPLASPIGKVSVAITAGVITLWRGQQALLATDVRGSIANIRFGVDALSFSLPPRPSAGAFLRFAPLSPADRAEATIDGRAMALRAPEPGIAACELDASDVRQHVSVKWTSP